MNFKKILTGIDTNFDLIKNLELLMDIVSNLYLEIKTNKDNIKICGYKVKEISDELVDKKDMFCDMSPDDLDRDLRRKNILEILM